MTLRTLLILINIAAVVVIFVIIGARVLSVRREPSERSPANQTPFYDDDVLEDSHLTRVLRWALVFSTIVAVALPLYWLLEPNRQSEESKGFDDRAIERGAVLFANKSMPAYEGAKSLLCADCHGADGSGGARSWVLTPEAQGDPKATPVQEIWKVPALNDVFYRYTEDPIKMWQQITQVITYGRPGTPMPAWGVAGGGPKNEQAVSDLVAYLKSIQITPAKAKLVAAKKVAEYKKLAAGSQATAESNLATAQASLKTATTPLQKQKYQGEIDAAQKGINQSIDYNRQVQAMGQGELLFNTQCARCHTKGWSTLEPSNGFVPFPEPAGSGALGPSLRGDAVESQFPGETGKQKQHDWVSIGVEPNKAYGVRGISSGRMPHFGEILSKQQIDAIIEYERSL
ncbi:MAG: cytochrome c [Acidimicrobiia bacterium]